MLEHVEEDDRVRASGRVVELLERLLVELHPEALAPGLDGPLRRLDATSGPACASGRVEEESQVGADFEEPLPAHRIAAHRLQDPFEELASPLLLAEVVLVDDVRVARQDLLAGERGS